MSCLFTISFVAAPYRPSLVPQCTYDASLSVATVPGSPVSTHAPPLLARTRRRSWYRRIGSSKLHKCPIYPISDSTQLPSTFTPSTLATSALTPSYGFTEFSSSRSAGSDVSFADSPSTLSRAKEIRRRFAGTARTYSSGYQTDASRSESERESEDHQDDESRTPSGTARG